jgi:hypothetical protein
MYLARHLYLNKIQKPRSIYRLSFTVQLYFQQTNNLSDHEVLHKDGAEMAR